MTILHQYPQGPGPPGTHQPPSILLLHGKLTARHTSPHKENTHFPSTNFFSSLERREGGISKQKRKRKTQQKKCHHGVRYKDENRREKEEEILKLLLPEKLLPPKLLPLPKLLHQKLLPPKLLHPPNPPLQVQLPTRLLMTLPPSPPVPPPPREQPLRPQPQRGDGGRGGRLLGGDPGADDGAPPARLWVLADCQPVTESRVCGRHGQWVDVADKQKGEREGRGGVGTSRKRAPWMC